MKQCVLGTRNITFSTENELLLSNITFDLFKGEILGIAGLNGVGKTILAKILCGIEKPDNGSITVNGKETDVSSHDSSTFDWIGYIGETPNILNHMSVAENLFIGNTEVISGLLWRKKLERKAKQILEKYNFPIDPSMCAKELSTSKRYMVQVARQLYRSPKVLMLDNIIGSFSENEIIKLLSAIEGYLKTGGAVVYFSHNYTDVANIASRIIVIKNCSIVMEIENDEISKRLLRKVLYGSSTLSVIPKAKNSTKNLTYGNKYFMLEEWEANNINKLTLTIEKGEVLGIIGTIMSGKSSFIQSIGGFNPAKKGKIWMNGKQINIRNVNDALKYGIVSCLDIREELFATGYDNIKLNISASVLSQCSIGPFLSTKREEGLAHEYCAKLNIQNNIYQPINELNNATKLKVVIARCMAMNPKLLLLDEPNKDLDRIGLLELSKAISNLHNKTSVIIALSKIDDTIKLCDRIIVFNKGNIIATLYKDEIDHDTLMDFILAREVE